MRSKLTGFEIEVGLTGIVNKRLIFQLVIDQCSNILHIHIGKRNPQTSTFNLRIPLTLCGFRLQLQNAQQLNLTIQMSYYLLLICTNCSKVRKYGCGFRRIPFFWSDFERYTVLGICLWNPEQQRRSKKRYQMRIPQQT